MPNPPAFDELYPYEVAWHPLDERSANQIRNACGFDGRVERMAHQQTWPRGYYRVWAERPVFVKVTTNAHAKRQQKADNIAQFLDQKNIAVSRLLPGFPRNWDELSDEYQVLAYYYLDAELLAPTENNLSKLGAAIAQMHLALSQAPFAQEVKLDGLARHQSLCKQLDALKSAPCKLPPVQDIFQAYDGHRLEVLLEDAQCIHGDLNFGNVMLDRNNQTIVFLDFEDALSAWSNPLNDLAFVIERFILVHETSNKARLLSALLQSYYQACHNIFYHAEHLVKVLQALSVRSLLILQALEQQGTKPAASEWQKFVFLYHFAERNKVFFYNALSHLID